MKKFTTFTLVALFSLTLVGCGGGTPEDNVKNVVSKMFDATKELDFDAISTVLVPEEAKKVEAVKAMMNLIPKEELEKQKAALASAKMTFGEVKITGDTATCETIISGVEGKKDEKNTIHLKKIDGKWLLAQMPK